MIPFDESLKREQVIDILKKASFHIGPQGHVFPKVSELPKDYPWTYGGQGPYTQEHREAVDFNKSFYIFMGQVFPTTRSKNKVGDYPLPCAYLSDDWFRLVNTDKKEITPYHEQLSNLISGLSVS